MKKHQNKKMKSQIVFIVVVLASAFLLIINFIPTFIINAGLTTEFTDSISSDYSTYVNQSNPDMNYDDSFPSRLIGNSSETYLHFNLELLPKETERLYFAIVSYDFYDHDWVYPPPVEDVEINIILIEESWTASELTWSNKPKHGEIINTVNISSIVQGWVIERYNLQKAVSITEILNNEEIEDFSLCINITKNNKKLNCSVGIYSYLLWNYDKVILSYTNIISASVIFSMLIGTIGYLRKDISICTNCGAKKVHIEVICSKCDTIFDDDRLIKRSDYQLILILLWTFIFFEVLYLIIIALVNWLIYYRPFLSLLLPVIWTIIYYIIIKKKIKLYKNLKV